jgi:hypothetical protein
LLSGSAYLSPRSTAGKTAPAGLRMPPAPPVPHSQKRLAWTWRKPDPTTWPPPKR